MIEVLNQLMKEMLSVEFYIMLPFFMLLIALISGVSLQTSIKAAITLGIGFIGIFIVFDHFVLQLSSVLKKIGETMMTTMDVFDVGWPPMARIAWSYGYVPVLLLFIIGINIIAYKFRITRTLNIDIWNYWHFIFLGQMVHAATGKVILAFIAVAVSEIIILWLADWSADDVRRFTGVEGISITTLACVCYYPIGVFISDMLDKIQVIKNIKADPESLEKRLGFAGDPRAIGFVLGCSLGIAGNYPVKEILALGFNIAAVVYILPKMTHIISDGILPISEGVKKKLTKKVRGKEKTYIGIHFAILLGDSSVIVTGILMMPIVLMMSLSLPGIRFLPIGSLPNIISIVPMIVVACNRNILKSIIVSSIIMVGNFYVASGLSEFITALGGSVGYKVTGYDGLVTSFLEGGNLLRFWLLEVFQFSWIGFIILPMVIIMLYYTKKVKSVDDGLAIKKTLSDQL